MDSVLIAYAVVDERRKLQIEGWTFWIDFKKAHDTVDWEFLVTVLGRKGFGSRWLKWIYGCISDILMLS